MDEIQLLHQIRHQRADAFLCERPFIPRKPPHHPLAKNPVKREGLRVVPEAVCQNRERQLRLAHTAVPPRKGVAHGLFTQF